MTTWECWVEGEYGTLQEVVLRYNDSAATAAQQFASQFLSFQDKYVEKLNLFILVRNKYNHDDCYVVKLVWKFEPYAVIEGVEKL